MGYSWLLNWEKRGKKKKNQKQMKINELNVYNGVNPDSGNPLSDQEGSRRQELQAAAIMRPVISDVTASVRWSGPGIKALVVAARVEQGQPPKRPLIDRRAAPGAGAPCALAPRARARFAGRCPYIHQLLPSPSQGHPAQHPSLPRPVLHLSRL